jgi:pyruvate,water dikinase
MGETFVRTLDSLGSEDLPEVGGKSANLGELTGLDVPVLPGFTTTASAYDHYLDAADLREDLEDALSGLDPDDVADLQERGERVRTLVASAAMPDDLRQAIEAAYRDLADSLAEETPRVAVRSSATAEDLPTASFAGQQETYLNVSGEDELVEAVKNCYASLFTDRAITYREDRGFDHFDVKLACPVQLMGRADADRGCSGVAFTIDPDTGFENVVVVEATYGLGELLVQGRVTPDRYTVFKPTKGLLERERGEKAVRMVWRGDENVVEEVPEADRRRYALDDDRVRELATYCERIEDHFGRPMDVEWLLDGARDELYVVQARPETVHASAPEHALETYELVADPDPDDLLAEGVAVGNQIGTGRVKILTELSEMAHFEAGDVLVTDSTDPDWEPVMRKAAAVITERGGKTSHAAIVSRELGIPAVVGAERATKLLRDGDPVTVDCTDATGRIYAGELDFAVRDERLDEIPDTETDVMLVLGDPERAFSVARLPVDGVGLAREEFVVASAVGDHPLYAIERGEGDRFVEGLRTGIGKIAAAFYPDPVVVRLSDFKSDEYRNLRGGDRYEPEEANPMLGWRGASRYYDPEFRAAFELECEALRQVRDDVGLDNLVLLVPFCRTPDEGRRVVDLLAEFGLDPDETPVYVMAELPSNVVRADEFADVFDGFSVGSNDLTQLVLGIDRNSAKLADLFREDDPAITRSIRSLVESAHAHDPRRPVGICGDAPSSVEGYVEFLLDAGLDSISVTPDVALETIVRVAELEERRAQNGDAD